MRVVGLLTGARQVPNSFAPTAVVFRGGPGAICSTAGHQRWSRRPPQNGGGGFLSAQQFGATRGFPLLVLAEHVCFAPEAVRSGHMAEGRGLEFSTEKKKKEAEAKWRPEVTGRCSVPTDSSPRDPGAVFAAKTLHQRTQYLAART